MSLSHHYRAAQALSPKAARLATRLLDLAIDVPFAWRLSLRLALLERGRLAPPFSNTDLVPLTERCDAAPPGSAPIEQARGFIRALRADRSEPRDT